MGSVARNQFCCRRRFGRESVAPWPRKNLVAFSGSAQAYSIEKGRCQSCTDGRRGCFACAQFQLFRFSYESAVAGIFHQCTQERQGWRNDFRRCIWWIWFLGGWRRRSLVGWVHLCLASGQGQSHHASCRKSHSLSFPGRQRNSPRIHI